MKIGIDIDGVLNDLHSPWLKLYNSLSSDHLTLDQVKDYDISKYVKEGWEKKIYNLLNTPRLFRNAPVQADARECVKALQDAGHQLFIISAFYPNPQICVEKTEWLKEEFPYLDLRHGLIFTKSKYMVDVDLMIDDCYQNLIEFQGRAFTILFDQPFNADEDLMKMPKMWRGMTWPHIVDLIQRVLTGGS